MNKHTTLNDLFLDIANKIRSKTGSTDTLVADNFPDEIDSIVTLSEGSSDATAIASDITKGKSAYVKGKKVDGTAVLEYTHVEETIFSESGTYTVPATGTYRICAIGAGCRGNKDGTINANYDGVGSCGGAGYLVTTLKAGATYTVTVDADKSSFGSLITATKAIYGYGNYDEGGRPSKSGSVSGTGVIPFESNDKTQQKDIIPPSFWENRLSWGGRNLQMSTSYDSSYSGGRGLFGGNGGDTEVYFYHSYTGVSFGLEAGTGDRGGGAGAAYNSYDSVQGSGGGGGYGGGAGSPNEQAYSTSGGPVGYSGAGGSGCIFIEKIG